MIINPSDYSSVGIFGGVGKSKKTAPAESKKPVSAAEKYERNYKKLTNLLGKTSPDIVKVDLNNGDKKLTHTQRGQTKSGKDILVRRVYVYAESEGSVVLKSIANYYYVSDDNGELTLKTKPLKYRDEKTKQTKFIEKPTNRICFDSEGKIEREYVPEVEEENEADEKPSGTSSGTTAPSGESPSETGPPEAAPEAPPTAPPGSGGSSSGGGAPSGTAPAGSGGSTAPAAPAGGSSSGTTAPPAAPAGAPDTRGLGTGPADFKDIVTLEVVDNRAADKKGKYNAGEKIQLKASVKQGKAIPSNGLDGNILFKGTDGTVVKKSITVFDENNFEVEIPSDIKTGDYRIVPANKDGNQEGNPIGDKISITAAGTAPVDGANPVGSGGPLPVPKVKIVFLGPGDKPITDTTKWKVKPDSNAKFRVTLEDPNDPTKEMDPANNKYDIPVVASLKKDSSQATSYTPSQTIPAGKNFVDISIKIPADYATGDTFIVFDVNPHMRNNEWVRNPQEDEYVGPDYRRTPATRIRPELYNYQTTVGINVDKAAFDVDTKTKKLMKRAYNPKTRMWKSVPTDFKMPVLPDSESNMNDIGGWYTKTKFGPEDTEDFNVGLYYHKNAVNCEDSTALCDFATKTALPQKTGFCEMCITAGTFKVIDDYTANCANGVTIENKAYEMECKDKDGSTYIVRIHTDIEKGPFGRSDSNILMHIVETSKPTKAKDGTKAMANIKDAGKIKAWDKLEKANGKIEEVIPEKKEEEKKK